MPGSSSARRGGQTARLRAALERREPHNERIDFLLLRSKLLVHTSGAYGLSVLDDGVTGLTVGVLTEFLDGAKGG